MSLVVNNNLMAANVARNLNSHYGRLQTSTQRLSSGLRINSAADDAAGLAIRELQRADIAALQQGARNANDAISMIQVADGSLGIIDEKLIRMKELAEQAATGTYDSTQRLMIESEYQAMASEITRIANATDFNGTKLLDGTLDGEHDGSGLVSTGQMKIHFGTGNDSAEDYYYIHIGECTSQAFGLGNASTWQDVQERGIKAFEESLRQQIRNDKTLSSEEKGQLLAGIEGASKSLNEAITNATDYKEAYKLWSAQDGEGFLEEGKKWTGNSDLMERYLAEAAKVANADAQAAADAAAAAIDATSQETLDKADEINTALQTAIKEALDGRDTTVTDWTTTAAQTTLINQIQEKLKAALEAKNLNPALANNLDAAMFAAAGGNTATPDWGAVTTALGTAFTGNTAVKNDVDAEALTQAKQEASDAALKAAGGTPGVEGDAEALDKFWNGLRETEKQKLQYAWGQAALYNLANAPADREPGAYGIGAPDFDFTKIIGPETTDEILTAIKSDLDTAWTKNMPDFANGESIGDLDQLTAFAKPVIDSIVASAKKNGLTDTTQLEMDLWAAVPPAGFTGATQASDLDALKTAFVGVIDAIDQGALEKALENSEARGNLDLNMLNQAFKDMQAKVGHMDFAGHTIETQEDAQHALDAINNAIVSKDKIRAHLGATQNRLENTVSNLNIQAENLQAAESRISDVDVATEMTEFVRNQILTQSAVAMLGQANSLPQMAMQLIGG